MNPQLKTILNYLKFNIKRRHGISDISKIIFNITWNCNSRCEICDIWKYKKNTEKELTIDEIKMIFKEFKNLNNIVITGGEPFLRDDLPEIISCISATNIRINTNGLASDKIVNSLKKILKLKNFENLIISISIHGIGSKHDKIRGVPKAYKRALKTLNLVKELSYTHNNLQVIIVSVITKSNMDDVWNVYKLSKKIGVNFFAQIVHGRPPHCLRYMMFLNEKDKKNIKRFLTKLEKENPVAVRSLFYRCYNSFLKNPTKQLVPCRAGVKDIVIDPYGNIYPCVMLIRIPKKMGSLREKSLKQVLESNETKGIRSYIRRGNCSCWLWCEAPISMYHSPKMLIKMGVYKLGLL